MEGNLVEVQSLLQHFLQCKIVSKQLYRKKYTSDFHLIPK